MIRLRNINKTYGTDKNGTHALKDVSLEIAKGELVAVMGTSGSGKSTLLNILGCMDKSDSGEYWYHDMELHRLNPQELHLFRKEHIGFVFQHFALMNQYTVYENVELPLAIKNIPKRQRRERVYDALTQVGIKDIAKKMPAKISGGQQQRCAIARAIASGNELILADEPTGALDTNTSDEMMSIFEELNRQGKTIIIVTHDAKIADRAKRIFYMEDGKILGENKDAVAGIILER